MYGFQIFFMLIWVVAALQQQIPEMKTYIIKRRSTCDDLIDSTYDIRILVNEYSCKMA